MVEGQVRCLLCAALRAHDWVSAASLSATLPGFCQADCVFQVALTRWSQLLEELRPTDRCQCRRDPETRKSQGFELALTPPHLDDGGTLKLQFLVVFHAPVTQMMFTSALFIFRAWFGGGEGRGGLLRARFFFKRFIGIAGF